MALFLQQIVVVDSLEVFEIFRLSVAMALTRWLVQFIGAFRIRSGMPFEMPFASLPHCGVILHVVGIGC